MRIRKEPQQKRAGDNGIHNIVDDTAILRVSSAEDPGANSSATLTALEAAANVLQLPPLWIHTTLLS